MTSGFIQRIFCDISLEKNPDIWKDDGDSEEKNIQRIRFLFEDFEETKYLAQLDKTKSTNRKNEGLAKALKEKGNKSYCAGDNIQALQLYNQALCFSSPSAGSEYSIVLANRSALWYELSEYEFVERDVELAIRGGYPEDLQFKLFERRARGRKALGKNSQALEDAKACIKSVSLSSLDEEKKKQKVKDVKELVKELEKLAKKSSKSSSTTNGVDAQNGAHTDQEPRILKQNELFPAFSDAVSIRYEEGRGRYGVASRDINIGELIASDIAFVSQTDKEFSKTNCWHCLKCTKCPIPCETCSGVVYCSVSCRNEADSTYHKYECMYTDILYQAQLGAWRLAYKAFTFQPWSFYLENKEKYLNRNELMGVKATEPYVSKDLNTFHSLVTHDGTGTKAAPELMMQAHVVVFFIRLLVATNYLPQLSEDDSSTCKMHEVYLTAARILHHFMRAAFYNTHEITQVEKTGSGWNEIAIQRIGRVTNPTLALINHSCDPNYRRVSSGNKTYGFACKPIRKGQEIQDLYCKPFSSAEIEDRRTSLKKYNFDCICSACTNNWPPMMSLPSQLDNLPPNKYSQPPNKVNGQIKRVLRAEENFNKLSRKESVTDQEILTSISTVLDEHYKLLKPPHQTFVHWENLLHQVLLNIHSAKVHKILSGTTVVSWPWEG